MKVQLQGEASECGLACLAMIASHYGHHSDMRELRQRYSISLKGVTASQLVRHASAMELATRPLKLELHELPQLRLPCILHWNLNHFVVLKKVKRNLRGQLVITLLDPAIGERQVTEEEASARFSGVALELTPTPAFLTKRSTQPIGVRDLSGPIHGLRAAVAQLFVLALVLEIFAIGTPLFNQFIIDEVIVSGDRELLGVLVVGFALMMITQACISLARSWFLMRWSMDVAFQWGARVFTHLMRLPPAFFEKRYLGDVASRFGSLGAIQNTVTNIFVESALDSLMAVLALAMMVWYSGQLTAVVACTTVLYAMLRWVFYRPLRDAAQERLVLSAKESSHFLETLRATTALKLFGRENDRCAQWLNLKMDVQNRDIRTQKTVVLFRVLNTALFGTQSLLIFYCGADLVMSNALTIGMLMAFSSYSGTFSSRVFGLIDMTVEFRMLGLHCERLADIVHTDPEANQPAWDDVEAPADTTITLRNVRFRYADGEPLILDGVNLSIPAGQSVALVGHSGCGKSTLLKIILGLLNPVEGEVLIGGKPISQIGLARYRQLVGTVMQDDVLLAGSISDNISFFDQQGDLQRVKRYAAAAAIAEDIDRMPMGYQTLVGDMGSSLSGGQKQRILLARALYKEPRILALDEATSHLDTSSERKVNDALRNLALTRIVIAHRQESIDSADRVIGLDHGTIAHDTARMPKHPHIGPSVAAVALEGIV